MAIAQLPIFWRSAYSIANDYIYPHCKIKTTWRHILCTVLKEIIQHKSKSSKAAPDCDRDRGAGPTNPLPKFAISSSEIFNTVIDHIRTNQSTYLNFIYIFSVSRNHNFSFVLLNNPLVVNKVCISMALKLKPWKFIQGCSNRASEASLNSEVLRQNEGNEPCKLWHVWWASPHKKQVFYF